MSILKVFTAFSGYDSQCMALDRLGVDYELVGWSEIDRYAIIAHNAVYPQWSDRNLGDICKIDWNDIPDFELFTYSFPCTDISSAGQQRGLEEGSGTRSSLLWECKKAIDTKKPKYLLMENVKALQAISFCLICINGCRIWTVLDIQATQKFSMLKISEFRRIGRGCLLFQSLEKLVMGFLHRLSLN